MQLSYKKQTLFSKAVGALTVLSMVFGSLVSVLIPATAYALTTGGQYASVAVNETSVGTVSWPTSGTSNVSNATTSNNSYAAVSLGSNAVSRYIKATGFGFSIPANSTIDGVTVSVERKASDSTRISDSSIRLVKGGTIVGDNKVALFPSAWGTSDTTVAYGSATDLWNSTWTLADINSANFGVVFSAKHTSSSTATTAYVDSIKIEVNYTTHPTPAANPVLGQSCGLDIALVMDASQSISSTDFATMKTDFNGFVDSLAPATPTDFSVTSFVSTATVRQAFTLNTTLVKSAVNSATRGGGTNWEDGLIKAQSTFDPRPGSSNLIVFASDGQPTHKGNGVSTTDSDALDAAVLQANAIKATGTRIITLGLGTNINADNMKAISSADAYYPAANYATLATALQSISTNLCGGTVTAHKVIDADGNLQTTNDQTPGVAWTISVGNTSGQTDGNGTTTPVSVTAGSYNVLETQQEGYSLVNATCSGATGPGSMHESGNGVYGVQVGNLDIVSCTFYNSPNAGTLTVIKNVINDDQTGTASASDFTLDISGGATPNSVAGNIAGTAVSVPAGANYSVTEEASQLTTGYHTSYSEGCSGTMTAGGQATCTVTNDDNAPTTGTITVNKVVVNDNGGDAEAGDFTLTVGETNVTNGQATSFEPGTYTIGENGGPDGYSASSYTGDCASSENHSITVVAGQSYSCTITNDDQPAHLTIKKVVINDNGGTAVASDFSYMVNDGDAVAFPEGGEVTLAVDTGNYVVTEPAAGGYSTSYSESCSENKLGLGESSTCTITNNDIAPSLTLTKIVNNEEGGTAATTDWTLTAAGGEENSISGAGGAESGDNFKAGTYTLSESWNSEGSPEGYTAGQWVCEGGDLSLGEGEQANTTITLGLDQSASCSITNTFHQALPGTGTLTINKVVINDNGGTAAASDFTLLANAVTLTNGVAMDLGTGSYQISETGGPSGYTATYSGACANDTHTIDIAADQSYVCTITNNDNPVTTTTTTTDNGGGGGGGGGGSLLVDNGNGGGGGGGSVLGAETKGEVLGASCNILLSDYIRRGRKNNPDEVKKLQGFLNSHEGQTLPVTGFYGAMTEAAINSFQVKYADEVLTPWTTHGLTTTAQGTGYVYKTTKRWVNKLNCEDLYIPAPELP